MPEKTTAFVSSTRKDLTEFRRAVRDALQQHGFSPIAMEGFGARPEDPVEVCLKEVTASEVFIGIYAWRYGHVPVGSRFSITEQEFQEARRREKPCFCYLVDESGDGWAERDQGEPALRLSEFKERVRQSKKLTVGSFTSPEDLAQRVVADLGLWRREDREKWASLTPERRTELKLLKMVRNYWTDDLVPLASRIELARKVRALALAPRAIALAGEEPPQESWEPLLDVLRSKESLLIEGERGAGKSHTLVELCLDLAGFTERDPTGSEPIPVIFNLASWSTFRGDGSLKSWLIHQLVVELYRRKAELAADWLENDRLVLLLDGLSEVAPEKHPACVDAINGFLDEHGDTRLVVCCHSQVPVRLRLKLLAAVALEPLNPTQVATFLGTDPAATALCAALTREGREVLWHSPLMLKLTQDAFRRVPPEKIDQELSDASEPLRSVCARYTRTMLDRPGMASSARAEPTQRSLAWIASQMRSHSLALFQLEQLEPSWLPGAIERWAYALLSRSAGGALLALPMALCWRPALWLLSGLLGGAFVGAVDTFPLRRSSALARSRARTVGLAFLRFFLIASGTFVLFNLLSALGLGRDRGASGARELRAGLLDGAFLALVFSAVFGVRGLRRDGGNDIQVSEALGWAGWSWRGAMKGGVYGMAALLAVWLVNVVSAALGAARPLLETDGWSLFLVVFGLLGGFGGGILGGLEGRSVDGKARPNQGIWLALRNAGLIGLCTLAAAVVGLEGIFWSLEGLGRIAGQGSIFRDDPFVLRWLAPTVGLTLALWVGLWAGGLDFLQHFCLRFVLGLRTPLPADCGPVLEHAVDRGLLVRRGGSYQFSPNLLRDYIDFPASAADETSPQ